MNAISDWLAAAVSGGSMGLLVIALAVATCLAFVLGLASLIASARDPARRRVQQIAEASDTSSADDGFLRVVLTALGPLGRVLAPGQGTERTRLERQLFLAGFRSRSAFATFFGIKLTGALILPAIWLVAANFLPKLSSGQIWFFAACALFVGMVLPNKIVERIVARRQRALRNGFPDALDLLVICVEAGLGLAAAIERVADELRYSHPELANELAIVNAEMRAGVERETALRNLTERTGLADVRGLVSLLVQTLRFGTGVAETLRVYSEEFRDKRTQAAEEQAAKMGTKLIFPLILCEFPAFFVVSVGPALVRIIDAFIK